MSESRTFVFPEGGNSGGGTNGVLAMLPALMQQRGVDPNILALMGSGNNRNGNGWGDDMQRWNVINQLKYNFFLIRILHISSFLIVIG